MMPATVTLTCEACGTSRDVPDRPHQGRPLMEWWQQTAGRRCQTCRAGQTPPADPTRPRPGAVGAGHPDTSRRAAELVAPRAGSQRAQLLDLAAEVGEFGMTAYEASVAISRSPNQTATRLQELREQGWIEYATDPVSGDRLERQTTPDCTGLVQRMTDRGMLAWVPTGFAGLAGHEQPAPAAQPAATRTRRRSRRPAVDDDTAAGLAVLDRHGLLDGATEVSPGLCARVARAGAR